MADQKISDLTAVAAALAAQEIPVNDAGQTKKLTVAQIETLFDVIKNTIIDAKGDLIIGSADDTAVILPIGSDNQFAVVATDTLAYRALLAADIPAAIDALKVGGGTVDNATFAFLAGVTSAIQTQLDSKADAIHKDSHLAGVGSNAFADGDELDATSRIEFLIDGQSVGIRRRINFQAAAGVWSDDYGR